MTRGCHRQIETASVASALVWKDYGVAVCLRALFGNTNSASMFVWYSYPFTRSEGEVGCLPQKMAGLLHGPASASYPSWSFSQRGHVRVFLTSSSLTFPPKSHNPTSLSWALPIHHLPPLAPCLYIMPRTRTDFATSSGRPLFKNPRSCQEALANGLKRNYFPRFIFQKSEFQ